MEFGYVKTGDLVWLWDAEPNQTYRCKVVEVTSDRIAIEGRSGRFRRFDGINDQWSGSRLVHAPFTASFPQRPKRKVTKETTDGRPASLWGYPAGVFFYIPINATNIKCTYEIEED